METLRKQLAYAKKQTSYAWAKYYSTMESRHEQSVATYQLQTKVVEVSKELPTHLVNEIQEMLVTLKKEIECPICMEVIGDLKITGCGHKFCGECFAKLDKCAICKRIIKKK